MESGSDLVLNLSTSSISNNVLKADSSKSGHSAMNKEIDEIKTTNDSQPTLNLNLKTKKCDSIHQSHSKENDPLSLTSNESIQASHPSDLLQSGDDVDACGNNVNINLDEDDVMNTDTEQNKNLKKLISFLTTTSSTSCDNNLQNALPQNALVEVKSEMISDCVPNISNVTSSSTSTGCKSTTDNQTNNISDTSANDNEAPSNAGLSGDSFSDSVPVPNTATSASTSNITADEKSGKTSPTNSVLENVPSMCTSSPKLVLGDMLWGKVSGHPWWPCMVALDPTHTIFKKYSFRRDKMFIRYHVQFFGNKGERGWLNEASLMPFRGREPFELIQQEVLNMSIGNNAQLKKDRQSFIISSRRQNSWNLAIAYAESAFKMSLDERLRTYSFVYNTSQMNEAKEKLERKKRKAVASSKESNSADCNNKVSSDHDGSNVSTDQSFVEPFAKRRKLFTSFDGDEEMNDDDDDVDYVSGEIAVSLTKNAPRSGRSIKLTDKFAKHLEEVMKMRKKCNRNKKENSVTNHKIQSVNKTVAQQNQTSNNLASTSQDQLVSLPDDLAIKDEPVDDYDYGESKVNESKVNESKVSESPAAVKDVTTAMSPVKSTSTRSTVTTSPTSSSSSSSSLLSTLIIQSSNNDNNNINNNNSNNNINNNNNSSNGNDNNNNAGSIIKLNSLLNLMKRNNNPSNVATTIKTPSPPKNIITLSPLNKKVSPPSSLLIKPLPAVKNDAKSFIKSINSFCPVTTQENKLLKRRLPQQLQQQISIQHKGSANTGKNKIIVIEPRTSSPTPSSNLDDGYAWNQLLNDSSIKISNNDNCINNASQSTNMVISNNSYINSNNNESYKNVSIGLISPSDIKEEPLDVYTTSNRIGTVQLPQTKSNTSPVATTLTNTNKIITSTTTTNNNTNILPTSRATVQLKSNSQQNSFIIPKSPKIQNKQTTLIKPIVVAPITSSTSSSTITTTSQQQHYNKTILLNNITPKPTKVISLTSAGKPFISVATIKSHKILTATATLVRSVGVNTEISSKEFDQLVNKNKNVENCDSSTQTDVEDNLSSSNSLNESTTPTTLNNGNVLTLTSPEAEQMATLQHDDGDDDKDDDDGDDKDDGDKGNDGKAGCSDPVNKLNNNDIVVSNDLNGSLMEKDNSSDKSISEDANVASNNLKFEKVDEKQINADCDNNVNVNNNSIEGDTPNPSINDTNNSSTEDKMDNVGVNCNVQDIGCMDDNTSNDNHNNVKESMNVDNINDTDNVINDTGNVKGSTNVDNINDNNCDENNLITKVHNNLDVCNVDTVDSQRNVDAVENINDKDNTCPIVEPTDKSSDEHNDNYELIGVMWRNKSHCHDDSDLIGTEDNEANYEIANVQQLCSVCEIPSSDSSNGGNIIQCQGPCNSYYHVTCSGVLGDESSFKCYQCSTGCHMCFVCKRSTKDTVHCSYSSNDGNHKYTCKKYYHIDCLSKYSLSSINSINMICPLHTCITCSGKHKQANKGKMYQCIKCPRSYHVNQFCLPTSCQILANYDAAIICDVHLNDHIDTVKKACADWCYVCLKGDEYSDFAPTSSSFSSLKLTSKFTKTKAKTALQQLKGECLVTCSTCPLSFHPSCVRLSPVIGEIRCKDCTGGNGCCAGSIDAQSYGGEVHYGDVVWCKIGCFRWWPAEIINPTFNNNCNGEIGNNLFNTKSPQRTNDILIKLFGVHLSYWISEQRLLPFQDGDYLSRQITHPNIQADFNAALEEASMQLSSRQAAKRKTFELDQKFGPKPDYYKNVKSNVPIGDVEILKGAPFENPACHCSIISIPTNDDDQHCCGLNSDCINRTMMFECHPLVCSGKDKCLNQCFTKRADADTKVKKIEGKGWGLFSKSQIYKGQFIGEYVGDLIDVPESKRRLEDAKLKGITNFYMLTLDKNRIIDAGPKGNHTRFMNHSCEPNCETQKWTVNGDIRIGLFALHDIPVDTELTFNYNFDCYGTTTTKCKCGSSICSGYLGVRPKTAAAWQVEKRSLEIKMKKLQTNNTGNYIYNTNTVDIKNKQSIEHVVDCKKGSNLNKCITNSKDIKSDVTAKTNNNKRNSTNIIKKVKRMKTDA